MKKNILIIASAIFLSSNLFSQENEIPETGNVGIGTTNPTEKLDVRGGAKIDSTLTVGDSMVVTSSARVGEDLRVNGNAYIEGNLQVNNELNLSNGPVVLNYLLDTEITGPEVLIIDAEGKMKRGGDVKSLVYAEIDAEHTPCKDDNEGYTTPDHPVWNNGPGKIYTSQHCIPNVVVGIGQNNPQAKLHIKTNEEQFTQTKAIIVEDKSGDKVFQVNPDGLVYAREVKVNLDAFWPDYVFETNYELMTLEQLQEYITKNGHLPNVPSACEMEEEGINISETSVMLMEKVEELTLYMFQLQDQLKKQQELLMLQQEVIEKLESQN